MENVVSQPTDGTTVLLDVATGEYFELNDVGAEIWERCRGTETVEEIVASLADEWDAPLAVLEADVLELLNELHRTGLIAYV